MPGNWRTKGKVEGLGVFLSLFTGTSSLYVYMCVHKYFVKKLIITSDLGGS